MARVTFYVCKHCGNIIIKLHDSGVPVVCCGEKMAELVPNTVDAAVEKHVPVVTITGDKVDVKIGEVAHPMIEEHHIQWIYLVGEKTAQLVYLQPGDEPAASFVLVDDEVVEVYEYCNLHGLWKKEV